MVRGVSPRDYSFKSNRLQSEKVESKPLDLGIFLTSANLEVGVMFDTPFRINHSRPKPVFTAEQVVVRVKAVSLSNLDVRIRSELSRFFHSTHSTNGIGTDFSGIVEDIGDSVTRFRPGDHVIGFVTNPLVDSSLSEYLAVPESVCTIRPTRFSDSEAASLITDCMIAERCLRLAKASEEDSVLITGGATPLTRAIMQIAKSSMFGVEWIATTVSSLQDREYSESIGADETFDISCNDGDWVLPFVSGVNSKRYDIVIDVTGESKLAKRLLNKGTGRLVSLFNKFTPTELLDFRERVGTPNLRPGMESILKSARLANLVTGCTGRMRYAHGRYFSVIPSGDGEILERLSVLMETDALTPCIEKEVDLSETASAIDELRARPFNLRGRIVVHL